MNSYLPTVMKIWSSIWNRWTPLNPSLTPFFNPLYEKLKMYYVTGGMPEPVLMWTEARDISAMQEALSGIIGAYEA